MILDGASAGLRGHAAAIDEGWTPDLNDQDDWVLSPPTQRNAYERKRNDLQNVTKLFAFDYCCSLLSCVCAHKQPEAARSVRRSRGSFCVLGGRLNGDRTSSGSPELVRFCGFRSSTAKRDNFSLGQIRRDSAGERMLTVQYWSKPKCFISLSSSTRLAWRVAYRVCYTSSPNCSISALRFWNCSTTRHRNAIFWITSE